MKGENVMVKKYVVRVSDGYSKVEFAFASAVNANNFALGALECCIPSDNKYRDEDGASVKIYTVPKTTQEELADQEEQDISVPAKEDE